MKHNTWKGVVRISGATILMFPLWTILANKLFSAVDHPTRRRLNDDDNNKHFYQVDCIKLLQTQRDPNEGRLYARLTKYYPQVWVSFHHFDFDKVRFGTFLEGEYYEKALTHAFVQVLEEEKDGIVIDVGGNVGWYSLLSAAMGHDVFTFEPNPVNLMRLCQSKCLNGWINDCPSLGVLASPAASAKQRPGEMRIHQLGLSSQGNQGGIWLSPHPNPGGGVLESRRDSHLGRATVQVRVVTLDQMTEQLGWQREIAILKVDVEGLEDDVLLGGQKLLASKRVRNIFTEGNLITPDDETKFLKMANRLVKNGYVVHKLGGHLGPTRIGKDELPYAPSHANYTLGVQWGCKGWGEVERLQCNIWWRFRDKLTP